MITLDKETHRYTPNVPGVTTIIKRAGLFGHETGTEEDLQRGSAVHLATQYLDEGKLDRATVDPRIKGYLDAYEKFKRDVAEIMGWQISWAEMPVIDKTGIYAGTPDRGLTARPRKLIDIKTGAFCRWHPIQMAGYLNCLDDPFSYSRYGLYLRAGGDYSLKEFPKSEFAADLAIFQSALNIYYWLERR